jgi:hypothetical protein
MAIFQSDLSIKTAIVLGLEDIRKDIWLLDDILGDCLTNPYLKDKYGQKQIDACKEWFKNNQIEVYMAERRDRDQYPCVTINLGTSQEKDDMKTMADQSTEKVRLLPNQIGKPIPYVVKPFGGFTYNPGTGELLVPSDTKNVDNIAIGMILVDPVAGQGYVIKDVFGFTLVIEDGLTITAPTLGVVPQYQFYEARVEHTFFQESYNIGCHVHGDPQALLWLHSIVLYSILRYRESLLEANGFGQSSVASSDMMVNNDIGSAAEEIFSRYITLSGQVENSWLKSPRRILEKIVLREKKGNGYVGGIKIISNLDTPEIIDENNESWTTVADSDDE